MESVKMRYLKIAFWVAGIGGFCTHCTTTDYSPANQFYESFQFFNPQDTLKIGLDTIWVDTGRTISPLLFLAALDSNLLDEMIYPPEYMDFKVKAYWKIKLDAQTEFCLFGFEEHWFKFKYGLIYSRETKMFEEIMPVAYFYGGEGGQVVMESLLINNANSPTLFGGFYERNISLSDMDSDGMKVMEKRQMELKRWQHQEFVQVAVKDSSKWYSYLPGF